MEVIFFIILITMIILGALLAWYNKNSTFYDLGLVQTNVPRYAKLPRSGVVG